MIKRNRTAYSLGYSEGIKVDYSIGALYLKYEIQDRVLRRALRKGYSDGLKARREVLRTWDNEMLGRLRRGALVG